MVNSTHSSTILKNLSESINPFSTSWLQRVFALVFVVATGFSNAQAQGVTSVTLQYSGVSICNLCGSGNYSCSSLPGWSNGLSFADPLPPNTILEYINVTYFMACDGGNFSVGLNSSTINSSVSSNFSCSCNACFQQTVGSTNSAVLGTYAYGGTNWINTIPTNGGSDGDICVDRVVVDLHWIPCTLPSAPTLEWEDDPVCLGEDATLQIGGSLNSADQWTVYTGSCTNGSEVTSTSGSSVDLSAPYNSSYFVRGTGGCVSSVSVSSVSCTSISGPSIDNLAPDADCQSITVNLDGTGNATVAPSQINDGSSDNCTISSYSLSPNTFDCSDIGANLVTLTVTDNNGNSNSCNAGVTIVDNSPPVLTCPSNIVQNTSAGSCGRNVTYTIPSVTDNCSSGLIPTRIAGPSSGAFFGTGTTTVTYQATDGAGLTATCSFDVTINDNQNPTLSCPTDITTVAAFGTCSATINYSVPTATDNCPGLTLNRTAGPATGASVTVGTETVTYEAIDASNNTVSCSFTITVTDTQDPVISCPSGQTVSAANGTCEALVTYTTPTATDNCPGVSLALTAGQASNTAFGVGTTTVTYVATDASNRTATCSFDITVEDNEDPVINNCPSSVNIGTDQGQCSSVQTWEPPTVSVSDNCPAATLNQTAGLPSGSAFPIGTTTVTYEAEDDAGNSVTCQFTVTVSDDENPAITCSPSTNITQNNDQGLCSAVVSFSASATDNCPGLPTVDQIAGLASGSAFPVGTTQVAFRATDAVGNTSECSFDVIISDNEVPAISNCPTQDTLFYDTDLSTCSAIVDINDPLAVDNCPGVELDTLSALYDGSTFPLGSSDVSYLATDASGNTFQCDFVVTVSDNEPPLIICPADQDVTFLNCSYTVPDYLAQALIDTSDNCTAQLTMSQSPVAGTVINQQTNVIVTAEDESGNTSSCAVTITPLDIIPPVINNCPNRFLVDANSADCNFIIPEFDASTLNASDECGATLSVSQSPAAGTSTSLDSVMVIVTVSDGSNNTLCSFYAVANDVTPPSITCPDDLIELVGPSCSFTIPDYESDIVSLSDNCDDNSDIDIVQSPISTTISGSGTVETVTFTATDLSGNQSTCSFTVTLDDEIPPVAVCPPTQDVYYNANCIYLVEDFTGIASATDNCPGTPTLLQSPSPGTNVGGGFITITATDAGGNQDTCMFAINLLDTISPSISCPQPQPVNVDSDCLYSLTDFTGDAVTSDACSAVTVSQDIAAGTSYDFSVTSSVTVTLTATDVAGNSNSCSFAVTLQDEIAPSITCGADIAVSFNGNDCSFTVGNRTLNYTALADNCTDSANVVVTQVPTSSTVATGQTTVTLTATDGSGNSSTCEFELIPSDNQAPTVDVCPASAFTVSFDANCNYTIADYTGEAQFDDNCDQSLNITQSPGVGTVVSDQSNTSVIITATDDAGNSNSCTITVEPQDDTQPTIDCPADISVDVDASCEFTIADYTGLATTDDNCDASVAVTQTVVPAGTVVTGNTVITLDAADDAGNTAQCTFNVTPGDNTPPSINCPVDQDVSFNTSCQYNIVDFTSLGTGIDDNCDDPVDIVVTQSLTVGTSIGDTTQVTLTATDLSGNSTTCSFDVNPSDNTNPTISCPADVVLDADASCGYDLGDYTSSAITNDFCDTQVDVTQSPLPITGIALGVTTSVTLTATDDAGNQATCSFNVSAADNTAPSITCPTDTVVTTDANCQFVMIDETSNHELVLTDNCVGVSVIGQAPSAGTVLTGNTTVTLTAQDAAGNTASCTYEYTVEDQVDPTITCPGDQLISSNVSCVYIIPDFTNSALVDDNCTGSLTVTQSPLPIINSIVVDTVITLTVTDAGGNTADCSFLISADDGVLPNITCPGDQLVGFDANCEYDLLDYTSLASATDNCGAPTITQVQAVDSTITGTTTITLIAEDTDMNTVSCTFDVIPSDLDAPVLNCLQPAITVSASGQCSVQLDDYTTASFVTATDNCSSAPFTFTQSPVAGALIGGATVVTISTTDADGNVGTCTMTVTPEDDTAPSLVCPADATVSLDGSCEYDILDYTGLVFVSDNCDSSPFTITQFPTPDSTITGEAVVTVQLSVTDAADNTGSCSLTVTTVDDIAPTITCPDDSIVSANANCEFALGDLTGEVTVDDNCTNAPALVQSPAVGTYSGTVAVTITATDDAGNANSCTFQVSAEDDTAPSLTCPTNQTPDFTSNCQFTIIDYTSLASFSDFCDNTPFVTQSPGIGTLISGDTNVTITVIDGAGNDSTCTFQVSPVDITAPDVECPADFEVTASASCDYQITDYTGLLTIDDNCDGSPSIQQTPADGNASISGAGASQQITMLVTDAGGNSANCSFNITLVDETAPALTCPQDQEVDFGPSCQFLVPSYLGQTTPSDNCDTPGDVAMSQSPLAGSSVGGITTVTVSGEDASGNVGTCTFQIIPDDNQAPNIFGCPADITVDNDEGVCGAVVTFAAITATDNCDGVVVPVVTQGQASGTVFQVGTTAVEFTATDAASNSSTCQFNVTVEDTEDPVVVCPNDISVNTDPNTCTAVVTYSAITASDNCTTPITATLDPGGVASGGTFVLGTTTISFSATDGAGNVGSCSFDVTVVDDEDPVITCPTDIVTSTGTNSCNAFVNYNSPTVSDNCANGIVPTLTAGQTSGSSFAQGTTTVSYQAEDASGNTASCSFTITVEDNENPLILACPLDIIENIEPGTCGATIVYPSINATDNCAGVITPTLTSGQASGTVFPLDTTVVTYEANDGNGNISICSFEVVIIDNEEPVITCPADITVTAEANTCGADVTYQLPTITDNCTSPITPLLVAGEASGDNFPVGTTTVTYSADDGNGNTASCSFEVTVTDDEMPEITCPPSVTVDNDPGVCGAVVTYDLPTVTDNCTSGIIPTQTLGLASGEVFPVGTTTNRYQAVDASGNVNLCSFTVTVNDVEDPVLTCPTDVTVSTDPSVCQAVATYDPVTVTDNCTSGIIPVLQSGLSSGDPFPEGPTTVTYVGIDAYGNSSTCSFTVTVNDGEAPAVTCPQDLTESFDLSCQLAIPDYTGLGASTDNCDASPMITQLPAPATVVTGTTEVTLTATDLAGNSSTCTFMITDDTPPTVTCPADQEVGFNINCEYDLPDYTQLVVSADNCGATSLTQSPVIGTSILSQTTVTITAEDDFGNTSTCDFEVIPEDDISPSITCLGNQSVFFDLNCEYLLPNYTTQALATDNCDTDPAITQDPAPATTVSGLTQITLTTTDDAGNSTSCTFDVIPVDNEDPIITCPGSQIEQLNADCEYLLSDYTSLAVGSDNCDSDVTLSQSPAIGSLQSLGTVVTLTAQDDAGNSASCVFAVVTEDVISPTVTCPNDITVDFDENCSYTLVDYTGQLTVDDNCSNAFFLTQSPSTGTVVSSTAEVTLTAFDEGGNQASCSFNVIPEDNIAPEVVCASDLLVVFDENCEFEIGDYVGFATTTDNCSNSVAISQSPAPGVFINGTSTVTLTGTDDNGNSASCTFDVIPEDDEVPTITCPDDQEVSLNANCEFVLPDYTLAAVVSDNCSGNLSLFQGLSSNPSGLGGFPGDAISVDEELILIVADESGNTASCTFSIITTDDLPPSVSCPTDQTVQLNSSCEFEIADYSSLLTVSDNCGLASQSQLPAVGTLVNEETEVTMMVTDNAGNTSTCTFLVTPDDNEAPSITCPTNVTADIDENCQFELPDYTGDAVVVDNCGVLGGSVAQFPPQGTVVVATTVITLTASDSNGNESDCSFEVAIEDASAPEITVCSPDQELNLNGNCTAVMPDYTGLVEVTDNCDVTFDILQIPAAGSTVSGSGTQTVTISVEDSQGNTDICEFVLTTIDDTDPTIECPADQILALTASCAFIVPDYSSLADVDDACGGTVIVTQSPIAGSVITSQLNATLIAEDEDGNTATCTFFVDVVDYEMEVTGTDASCQGGSDGTATVTVSGGEAPYTEDWGGFDPNALSPGTYAVTVTDANGCVLTDEVTIGDGPTFQLEIDPSGEVVICAGTSLSVDAGPGYADYDWSTGASVQVITVSNEGDYWVTVTSAEGCVADDTVSVSFFDAQVPTINPDADGVLYCSNDTAQSYQWYVNGDPIPDATNSYYCPLQSGNYYVEIVDANGCTIDSEIEEHTFNDNSLCATSIDEYGLTLDVYPNPSTGIYTVRYELDHQAELQLSVVDLFGRQVVAEVNVNALSGNEIIDISKEADGVYILRIVKDGQSMHQERLMLIK